MRSKSTPAILLLSVAAIFVVSQTVSQETGSPSPEELMKVWAKYADPGDHHKFIEPLVGVWDLKSKWWVEPGTPARESGGTSECTWIMGGRFLSANITGEMTGKQFHGMSILGYDNFRQQYVSFWIDDMSTTFMLATGKSDESGKVFTFTGTYDDLMTGEKDKKFKAVYRILSDDSNVYESYEIGADGAEFKSLEVTYTRKK